MRSFAGRCVFLAVLALFPAIGFADQIAICEVVAVDEMGLVTATETATGTTFKFKPPPAALRNLAVGAALEADIAARVVFLGQQRIAMRALRRGEAPPKPRQPRRADASAALPEQTASAEIVDIGEAELPPRSVAASDPARPPKTAPPAVKSAQTRGPATKSIAATSKATLPSVQTPVKTQPKRPSKRQPGGGASTPPSETATCYRTGCSGQVCADRDVITTCEYRPEYACYKSAQCARQADGTCGWTETTELQACLENPPQP